MRFPADRLPHRAWLLVPLLAAISILWSGYLRFQRAAYVSRTDTKAAIVDGASPTGYAGGQRWWIVPESNNASYDWISGTQQMFARHEWRVRHTDSDNAPDGRAVFDASPYRWWLGGIAWIDHIVSGRPIGISVERASLWSDLLIQLVLLAATTWMVARLFGRLSGALMAAGIAMLDPFAGLFIPGGPDVHGPACAIMLWSVLPLLAGIIKGRSESGRSPSADASRTNRDLRRLLILAGIAGGAGLWIRTQQQALVIAGLVLGGLVAEWLVARSTFAGATTPVRLPWRTWALAGAATSLVAYALEFLPGFVSLRLEVNHPLYALAWIGAGELLTHVGAWFRTGRSYWNAGKCLAVALAALLVAALPAAMVILGTHTIMGPDPANLRTDFLPDGARATSLLALVMRDGLASAGLLCLPLAFIVPVVTVLASSRTAAPTRAALALALGPVLVLLPIACVRLAAWGELDVLLLALAAAAAARGLRDARVASHPLTWIVLGLVVFVPGWIRLAPSTDTGAKIAFSASEVDALVERSLAHWIADHTEPGGVVILAPPTLTTTLCFHSGGRGLGTITWQNPDGLLTTVRIVTAVTGTVAQQLLADHGVTHVIIPSWNSEFDDLVRDVLPDPDDAFVTALHHWALPPWLRPLYYRLPPVADWKDRSVVILRVTGDANRVLGEARLAEYFVESGQLEMAGSVASSLSRYPNDLNALIARAFVERERGEMPAFAQTKEILGTSVESGLDRGLPWDRRVSLAITLAMAGKHELAREQLRQCFARIDAPKIRTLPTGSLFRLQALAKAYRIPLEDPALAELARSLLPPELRSRL